QRPHCIVVGVFESRKLTPSAALLDEVSGGYLSEILKKGDLEGKLGQTLMLQSPPNLLAERVLLVGCGPSKDHKDHKEHKKPKSTEDPKASTEQKGKDKSLTDNEYREILTKAISALSSLPAVTDISHCL